MQRSGQTVQADRIPVIGLPPTQPIISEPNQSQLSHVGYHERTGSPQLSTIRKGKNPDFIIEERVFDHYTVGTPEESPVSADRTLKRIWNMVENKVPEQADGLVIDLSNSALSSARLIEELDRIDFSGQRYIDPGFAELEEVFIMKGGLLAGIWVGPNKH